MKKTYCFITCMLLLVSAYNVCTVAQTDTDVPHVSMTFDETTVSVTATPATSRIFFLCGATETYGDSELVETILSMYDSEDILNRATSVGSVSYAYEDWGIEKDATSYTFIAAVVAWDATANAAVAVSPVVRKDTVFAAVAEKPVVSFAFDATTFTVTATPATSRIFFLCGPTEYVDSPESPAAELFADYLSYFESAEDMESATPVGSLSATYEDYRIPQDVPCTFLAATIAWDAAKETAVMTSDLLRKDTTFSSATTPDPTPIATIEQGTYYISTFVDGTQYLATSLSETSAEGYLGGLLYADSSTPTEANEFVFVSVADKHALFTIQDNQGRYVYQTETGDAFAVGATKPATGGEWQVEQKDYRGFVLITNTLTQQTIRYDATQGTYACRSGELETLNLPMLLRIGDIPSGTEQTGMAEKAVKIVENGQLVIVRAGVRYNVTGIRLQ